MLNKEHKKAIENSVLSWLASANLENYPNVSPKEIFTHFGESSILVANIASPNTVKNIKQNPKVCISVLDILVQKGFQFKGNAQIIKEGEQSWSEMSAPLKKMAGEKFPFSSLTHIRVESAKAILAPSYMFYPDTTEEQMVRNAKDIYDL